MRGLKPLLGGGIAAAIAAMAVGIKVYGYQDNQYVSVTSSADATGPVLAASAHEDSLRRLGLTPERTEDKALQERDVTLKAGDTLMGILLAAGLP